MLQVDKVSLFLVSGKNHLPVNFIPILTAFCWQKIEKKKNMISPEIQNETAKVYFKESNITGDVI